MNWWTDWESNPARVACKASLRPGGRPEEGAFHARLIKWCSDVVSSHALLLFRQALSPDQLSERISAFTRLLIGAFTRVQTLKC